MHVERSLRTKALAGVGIWPKGRRHLVSRGVSFMSSGHIQHRKVRAERLRGFNRRRNGSQCWPMTDAGIACHPKKAMVDYHDRAYPGIALLEDVGAACRVGSTRRVSPSQRGPFSTRRVFAPQTGFGRRIWSRLWSRIGSEIRLGRWFSE